jgi:hypothetical protein
MPISIKVSLSISWMPLECLLDCWRVCDRLCVLHLCVLRLRALVYRAAPAAGNGIRCAMSDAARAIADDVTLYRRDNWPIEIFV